MPFLSEFAAHLPFLITVSPLFGAGLVWLNERRGFFAARQAAVTNATLTLGLAVWMLASFAPPAADAVGSSPVQMTTLIPWWQVPFSVTDTDSSSPAVRVHWAFGVDGLSLLPLVVIALIGWVIVWLADRCSTPWTERSYGELLSGQAIAMVLFSAQDFLLFLVGCEAWAWWAFFVIGRQGGSERRAAAHRMLVVSTVAHLAWGLAGIGCAVCHAWIQAEVQGGTGGVSLLYPEMISRLARWVSGHEMALYAWSTFQPWVLLLWLLGLWCVWPIFPLHGWWRTLFSEGRLPLVALIAATSILQAGYVLFRFVVPLFPPAGSGWSVLMAGGASLGACYFGFLAISQTDWRKLASALSLFALHVALIGGLSGRVDASLMCWQTLISTSLVVAAGSLLIGRWEQVRLTPEFAAVGGWAFVAPRWVLLMSLCGGLLSAGSMFAWTSGQAAVEFLELQRLGVPNLSLLLGGLLTGVAMIRVLLQVGFGPVTESAGDERRTMLVPTDSRRDLQGRDVLIGVLVAAALSTGLMPNFWRPLVQPTFERLHDPFAGQEAQSSGAQKPLPRSSRISVTARKPDSTERDDVTARFGGMSAPLIWMIFGLGFLIAPRLWKGVGTSAPAAAVGLLAGLAVELVAATRGSAGGNVTSGWMVAVIWSLGTAGLVMLTVSSVNRSSVTNTTLGGWLMRFSAIGWAAVTQDLLLGGLAWELAESARRPGSASVEPPAKGQESRVESQEPEKKPSNFPSGSRLARRERMRRLLSSACFWLGVALCVTVTGTTEWDQIAAQLARSVPRDADGLIVGGGPRLGLAAVVLMVSALGMRCGLAPWSLGRRSGGGANNGGVALLDQWFGHLLGLTLLLHLMLAFRIGYGNSLTVMLTIAAVATAVWAAISTVGESRVHPLLRHLLALQFAGMVLLVAAAGFELKFPDSRLGELNSRGIILQVLSGGSLAITAALCGLAAVLRRLGEPQHGDLFFEHFRGLYSKCRLEAILLIGSLLSLIGAWPFGGFWMKWLGCLGVMLTPQRLSEDVIRPHAVLLTGTVVLLGTMVFQISAVARWLRHIAFDPAVSSWLGSGRRWDLIVAVVAVVLSLAVGLSPALFSMASCWVR